MIEHKPQISNELWPSYLEKSTWVHEVQCPFCETCPREQRVMPDDLEDFCRRVLEQYGAPSEEARVTAHILVAADLRGIFSHGVARLGRYINGIKGGYIRPGVDFEVQEPAPAIGVIDARNGLGQVAADLAVGLAISKAKANGAGIVTVKNSNHYGIAGYYALRAVQERMIGLSMTNSSPLVIPTFGAEAILGTNPLSLGAPAKTNPPFLLDMATSVVPRGKLEVYDRNRQQMPPGWAADEKGFDSQNPGHVLKNLVERLGGGILPLGGRGEEFGGHKGFGLSFMIDILSGVLSGSAFGAGVHNLKREVPPGEIAAPNVGHFFLVLDIGRFMPIEVFEDRLDQLIEEIKNSRHALDEEKIYIHGEKEFIQTRCHQREGIPLAQNVFNTLVSIGKECGVAPPAVVSQSPPREA